ncbi:MAG: Mrp/NBP35 family ATP-binding protein [Phycisphaeraceae bacterium]|nr:Mrp/NBP35 family ATP-binding protein [Phycisphaeraceae bacterium]
MPLNEQLVRDALSTVEDPDLRKDLVTLGMVQGIDLGPGRVTVRIELTTPACPMKDRIRTDIEGAIRAAAQSAGDGPPEITVDFSADVRRPNEKVRDRGTPLPQVRHVIAVGAGKGGVGKSTIAVNLAVGLARAGARAGVLDGDIFGPSLPTMLGLDTIPGQVEGNMLLPFEVHGIRAMTIGKLVEPDKALIWRGPMAHSAFRQLATQTEWGELDYLIIDLPPGTGDVPLTMAQLLPLSGAVVVCTPQRVALDDARRAIRMFQQLGIDLLGIVENMSSYVDDSGREHDLFGRGGAELLAQEMHVPFLGAVPLVPALRINSDLGTPLKNWTGGPLTEALDGMVRQLAAQVSIASMQGRFVQPTLSVH